MAKRGFNFNSVAAPKLKRSAFDLSHEHKLSCGMGQLIPIECIECVPGDSFKISPSALVRMQALISPMMQRVDASVLWFKVPYRIIWDDFEEFITGGVDGNSHIMPPYATFSSFEDNGNLTVGSLADYLGLPLPYKLNSAGEWVYSNPTNVKALGSKVSLLPFRAYQQIYNDYFIDKNLEEAIDFAKGSGEFDNDELDLLCALRRRAWKKDYFTSALPDAQRGAEVTIPLTGDAPVEFGIKDPSADVSGGFTNLSGILHRSGDVTTLEGGELYFDNGDNPRLSATAKLDDLSVIGITALRTAFKLQQFLERNNVAGSRYIEQILAHYGVKSSDERLQRSEFLGGGSVPIIISEIETNANSSSGGYDTVVGDLAGKAKGVGGFGTISTFCEEHCFIMGILSIMPKASYSQGLSKMWSRMDKFDYFWPEFQHIGEQAIAKKELFVDYFGNGDPEEEFGYQSRYSDYKYQPDRVSGDLRTSLSFWHMGRLFESAPALNASFIQCEPTDRVFATSDELSNSQHCVVDMWLDEKAVRPMSRYSTPKIS